MPHLFYDTFGYPFYTTFLWALGVMIPRWGWLLIGLLLGLFLASVITSARHLVLVHEIKRLWPHRERGYTYYGTLWDWVHAGLGRLNEQAKYNDFAFQERVAAHAAHINSLEERVATLTDERSRLRAQLDKSHNRPRDARGHFIKGEAAAKKK